jgi:hypothetical protein
MIPRELPPHFAFPHSPREIITSPGLFATAHYSQSSWFAAFPLAWSNFPPKASSHSSLLLPPPCPRSDLLAFLLRPHACQSPDVPRALTFPCLIYTAFHSQRSPLPESSPVFTLPLSSRRHFDRIRIPAAPVSRAHSLLLEACSNSPGITLVVNQWLRCVSLS